MFLPFCYISSPVFDFQCPFPSPKKITSSRDVQKHQFCPSLLKFAQAQYHGEVAFARHVERLVLPKAGFENHQIPHPIGTMAMDRWTQVEKYTERQGDIEAVCKKHGWEFEA